MFSDTLLLQMSSSYSRELPAWFCCLFVAVLPFTVSAETGKTLHC